MTDFESTSDIAQPFRQRQCFGAGWNVEGD
jgi:hypothetical protein